MKRLTFISVSIVLLTNLNYSQNVEIKDSAEQLLLRVNDEGENLSSVTIPNSATPPDPATNKLYNEGGALKWSGNTLATGSSLWTLSGDDVYRNLGNVGIGTTNPLSRLSVGTNGNATTVIFSNTFIDGGKAISGWASNSGDLKSYGGNFMSAGSHGRGVLGQSNGSNGIGVEGWASSTAEGPNYGGYFKADGTLAYGITGLVGGSGARAVHGFASHSTGINYGIRGKTNSLNGWAGYFEGRGYFSENVGIGTTAPDEKFHVEGNVKIVDGNQSLGKVLTSDANGVGSWQVAADGDWTISGSDIHSTVSGNVGIGTTSPLSKLSVGGNGSSTATIYGGAIGDNSYGVYGGAYTSSAYGVYGTASGISGRGVSGYASGSALYGVHGAAWDDGVVTNYGGYFQARGTTGRGVFGQSLNNTGTNYGGYFQAAGATGRGVYGKGIETGDVINYGGYFEAAGWEGRGVYGRASNSGSNLNYGGYFQANGSAGQGVTGRASGSSGIGVHGWASGTGAVINHGGYFWADGDNGRGVLGHGRAYNFYADGPGTDYGTASSIRWKQNIIEIDNPLEKLAELRGVYFDWDEEHGGHHDIGCIAEEVGKVLPEIVVYEENGIDADGMDYSKLTPLLVEAVKEQQKLIEDLSKRIEYLENN